MTLRWRAVIFDLDGTLIDTIPLIVASHRHAVQTVLGRDLPDEVLRSGIGRPLIEQMARVRPGPRAGSLRHLPRLEPRQHGRAARPLRRRRRAAAAARRGRRAIGVATSKSRDAVDLAFSIQPPPIAFDALVTVEDTRAPQAGRGAGADGDRAARRRRRPRPSYVGDAPYDIAGRARRRQRRGGRHLGRRRRRRAARRPAPTRWRRRRRSWPRSWWVRRERCRDRGSCELRRARSAATTTPTSCTTARPSTTRPTTRCCASCARSRRRTRSSSRPTRRPSGSAAGCATGFARGAPPAADAVARQRARRGPSCRPGTSASARLLAAAGVTDQPRYVTEPKIDGLAISLIYERRRVRARRDARRRRGRRGRHREPAHDPRAAARLLGRPTPPALVEVRGEVYLPPPPSRASTRSAPSRRPAGVHEPAQLRGGLAAPARPARHGAAPAVALVYAVGALEGVALRRRTTAALDWLRERGFPVNPLTERPRRRSRPCARRASAWEDASATSLDYEIDGVVVKVDALAHAATRSGVVGRDPRWAIAFKFPADARARRSCSTSASTSGAPAALNPFAILEPVEVGGVTVKLATLHNEDDIRRKDIRDRRHGDRPARRRRDPAGGRPGARPATETTSGCSRCRARARPATTPVVQARGRGASTAAPTARCPSRGVELIKHFVARGAMDIEGVGEKLVFRLFELGMIAKPSRPLPPRPSTTCCRSRGSRSARPRT